MRLREVTDVVRLGHVRAIHADRIELERGSVVEVPGTLYVDCATSWIRDAPDPVPIFGEEKIVLQLIQEVFNGVGDFNSCYAAALIGFLEAHYTDANDMMNGLTTPMKPVDTHFDWLKSQLHTLKHNRNLR